MPTTIAIVYHSGYGHTAAQAEAVRQGALEIADTKVDLIKTEDMDRHWATLEKADAIIFGAPTYMGSVSAPMKGFMDSTSKIWMQQGWKNKIAAGFTNSGSQSGDKLNSLIQLMIFAMQHGMIWIGLDLLPGNNSSKSAVTDLNRIGSFAGAMAQSNVDQGPDVAPPEADRKTASHLGRRVAEMAARFKKS
jgi:multimeric flavodoxin WrbA